MSALIFASKSGSVTDGELKQRLSVQFDDFDLVLLNLSEHTIYFEANQVIRLVRTHDGPVFLVVDERNPVFAAVVSAKLARFVDSFQVMQWEGKRFRVLRVP